MNKENTAAATTSTPKADAASSVQPLPNPQIPREAQNPASSQAPAATNTSAAAAPSSAAPKKKWWLKLTFWKKKTQKASSQAFQGGAPEDTRNEKTEDKKAQSRLERIKKLEKKFVSLRVERQVYILLGAIMLLSIFFNIISKMVLVVCAVVLLFSGLTGRKLFFTTVLEKAPWNKDKSITEELKALEGKAETSSQKDTNSEGKDKEASPQPQPSSQRANSS